MRQRYWLIVVLLGCGFVLAVGGAVLAKEASPIAPDVSLGEPGLSFRYTGQLGETQVPYLADPEHLNHPNGLFIDAMGNVYVTEELGARLLKYDSTGTNVLSIGNAGICNGTNTSFCQTWDSAVDLSGNLWVVDNNRTVQFDADGNYLQELGISGDDNYSFSGGVRGVATDSADHLYVSDAGRQRIQVYDLTSGTPVYSSTLGVTDVPSDTLGYFNAPHRLAVDSQDRLLVADRDNNRVQRCSYASGWTCELMDGDVNSPEGVGVDSDDYVYSTDYVNARIRKCKEPGACIDLITGTPSGPHDVVIDAAGQIFVSYQDDFMVMEYNSDGTEVGVFAGVQGVPYLTDSEHYNRARLEFDYQGNRLVLEELGQRLLKFDEQGNFQWQFGFPGEQGNDEEHLSRPHALTADVGGTVYVADNCRIVLIWPNGEFAHAFGNCGVGEYEFSWPTGIDIGTDGTLYVADYHNHRVQVYDNDLIYKDTLGITGECAADNDHLCTPIGVAVDADGNVYVADGGNNRIQKFNAQGDYLTTIGEGWGNGFGQFDWAEDVEVDAEGRVYVADWNNQRVQVFSPEGEFLTSIGGAWGSKSSQFIGAASVAVDSQGNLYVGDWDNTRFQVFAPGYPGWQQVNINGFGKRWNTNIPSMELFENQLYVGTGNWVGGGAEVWRTADGATWEQANETGFSEAGLEANAAVIDLEVFDGYLYASTGWRGLPGQIWRSNDGMNWEQVEDNGFDDPGNWAVTIFGVFQDQIYVATSGNDGVEIWRSETGNDGDWMPVVENGKGSSQNNFITDLVVFKDKFYAMVESTAEPKTGLQVWQSPDGLTWTTVVSDGFGNPENYQTGGATVFNGMLYVGTRNDASGAEIWRSADGVEWDQGGSGDLDNTGKIEQLFVSGTRIYATGGNEFGMKVYSSLDGNNWTLLVENGFGDSNSTWSGWTGVKFENHLFLGVSNDANGVKVWQMLAGDLYIPLVSKK